MSKHRGRQDSAPGALTTVVGIDVSKDWLDVSAQCGAEVSAERVANTAAGHRQLLKWLRRWPAPVRIALEATGLYSLDVALALHGAAYAVMVVNPRAARDFA